MKRTLRYLWDTLDYGLLVRRSTSFELMVYTDVYLVGRPDTCRSTSCYAVFLGANLVSWCLKRQNIISRSIAEAEACCLWWLLQELHAPLRKSTLVYYDNINAVYLSTNPIQHQCTKHVDVEIDLHFVRERVADDIPVRGYLHKGSAYFFVLLENLLYYRYMGSGPPPV
jgi:hypothetical protein